MLRIQTIVCLVLFGASCSNSVIHKDYYSSAQQYYAKGEWQDALMLATLATKQDFANDDAHILQAFSLSELGELTKGHQLLHERLSIRPHSTKLNLSLVKWHRNFGSKSAANEIAKRMIQRDDSNLEAHRVISEISLESENWQDAEKSLYKLFNNDKFDMKSAMSLGKLYLKDKRYDGAQQVFERLYESKTYKTEAAKYLGWIHAEKGESGKASAYIRVLAVEKQNDQFIQKTITRNLLNLNGVDKITVLNNYTNLFKDDWGQYQMYLALIEAGYKEQALDLLADVWTENPQKKWAAINYANHLYELGDKEVAESMLKKATENSDVEEQRLIASVHKSWAQKGPLPQPVRRIANAALAHKVKHGETLGGLAHKYLGDAQRWPEIYKINKSKIKNESVLSEGIELVIPQEQK